MTVLQGIREGNARQPAHAYDAEIFMIFLSSSRLAWQSAGDTAEIIASVTLVSTLSATEEQLLGHDGPTQGRQPVVNERLDEQ